MARDFDTRPDSDVGDLTANHPPARPTNWRRPTRTSPACSTIDRVRVLEPGPRPVARDGLHEGRDGRLLRLDRVNVAAASARPAADARSLPDGRPREGLVSDQLPRCAVVDARHGGARESR